MAVLAGCSAPGGQVLVLCTGCWWTSVPQAPGKLVTLSILGDNFVEEWERDREL